MKTFEISEYFSKYMPNPKKLSASGDLLIGRAILDGNFTVRLKIVNFKDVSVTLWDNDFDDECVSLSSSSLINEAYEKALNDLREEFFLPKLYLSSQANRINDRITDVYATDAEFLWGSDDGVYRHVYSGKWFAIIMSVKKASLHMDGDERINVINVKSKHCDELIKAEGFLPAYHMNKKYWITMLLDDTLEDDEIFKQIATSYEIIEGENRK